jgi:hypothetical protein
MTLEQVVGQYGASRDVRAALAGNRVTAMAIMRAVVDERMGIEIRSVIMRENKDVRRLYEPEKLPERVAEVVARQAKAIGMNGSVTANGVLRELCRQGRGEDAVGFARSVGIGRARVDVEMVRAKARRGDWKGVSLMVGRPKTTGLCEFAFALARVNEKVIVQWTPEQKAEFEKEVEDKSSSQRELIGGWRWRST